MPVRLHGGLKGTDRSLRLRREALSDLTDAELGAVAGGDDITVVLSRVRTMCYSCVSMCIKP